MKLIKWLFYCLICLSATATTALAEVKQPMENFFINDYANVTTTQTQQEIIQKAAFLDDATGAQIVFAIVDFTDGMTMEDYSYNLFNDWGIGDANKNNGLLVLLSIGDDNYWAVMGTGLEDTYSYASLDSLLNTYLDPYFDTKDYDTGVLLTFRAIFNQLCNIYGVTYSENNGVPANAGAVNQYDSYNYDGYGYVEERPGNNSFQIFNTFFIVIFILVLMVLIGNMGARRRRRYYGVPPIYPRRRFWFFGGYGHRHPPRRHAPPPPPRPMGRQTPPPRSTPRSGGGGATRGGGIGRSGGLGSGGSGGGFGGSGFGGGRSGGGGSTRGGGVGRK